MAPGTAPVVIPSGGNGSGNHGDEIMWLAAAECVHRHRPGSPLVTDGSPDWTSPLPAVTVLPYVHQSLNRVRRAPRNRAEAAAMLLANRGALERGLRRCVALRAGERARPGLEAAWEEAIAPSAALVFAGAGGMTDAYALHAVAGWGILTALAERNGVPVAFLGQGVGPLRDPALRTAVAAMATSASLFTTRDETSADVVREIAPGAAVTAAPDWAFAAPPSEQDRRDADQIVTDHHLDRGFVAVSLRNLPGADREASRKSLDIARAVVTEAAGMGLRTLFVPSCVAAGRNDDRLYMRKALAELPPALRQHTSLLEEPVAARVVVATIGRSRGVFSSRYHPIVFALAEGVPATAIVLNPYYAQKLEGALGWFGEADRVLDPTTSDNLEKMIATGIDDGTGSRVQRRQLAAEHRRRATAPLELWLTDLDRTA